jgi:hypothetical protein
MNQKIDLLEDKISVTMPIKKDRTIKMKKINK